MAAFLILILVAGAAIGYVKRCDWFPDLLPGGCLEQSTAKDNLPDVSKTSLCTGPNADAKLCQQATDARLQHGIVSDVKAKYAYAHYAKTLSQHGARLHI